MTGPRVFGAKDGGLRPQSMLFRPRGPVSRGIAAATFALLAIGLVTLYILIESLDLAKMFFAFALLKKGKWVRNITKTA